RLPAAPVLSLSPSTSEVIPMPSELTSRRILVVDDNVDAAESLSLLLANEGHETRVAHGGVQALEVARSFVPEVMILDLGMPGMDGYAVAREVRKDPALARMRLIALSGYGQTEDRRRTAAAGF